MSHYSSRHPTLVETLQKYERDLPDGLKDVVIAIASSCAKVAVALRHAIVGKTKANNEFGDEVLTVDLISDGLIGAALKGCKAVSAFSSEENPKETVVSGAAGRFFVGYDPLDGSSIISTNFAVGSIFGIWPGATCIGQRGDAIEASVIVQYGPRCIMLLAHRAIGVVEFLLVDDEHWHLCTASPFSIAPRAKIFAPGNLRASTSLPAYAAIVQEFIAEELTLRYTGGLVPDVVQILIKGNGIFATPMSVKHKVKLRTVFELVPVAFLVVCAGGAAVDAVSGRDLLSTTTVEKMDQRGGIVCGSRETVASIAFKLVSSPPSKL